MRTVDAMRLSAHARYRRNRKPVPNPNRPRPVMCTTTCGAGRSLRASPPRTTGFMATRCTTSGFSISRMRASFLAEKASRRGLLDERW